MRDNKAGVCSLATKNGSEFRHRAPSHCANASHSPIVGSVLVQIGPPPLMPSAQDITAAEAENTRWDAVIVGAGHNALVAAIILCRAGQRTLLVEDKGEVGGAARTERPFGRAPSLPTSTGAYLVGLVQPELLVRLNLSLPLLRRDPHYFLPTTQHRYLLFGSDEVELERQFSQFFSRQDYRAHCALSNELSALRHERIQQRFGMHRGHIHHIDNSFGFADRFPHRTPIDGLYSCSAGTPPAGSVIGSAGYIAATRLLNDLGRVSQR